MIKKIKTWATSQMDKKLLDGPPPVESKGEQDQWKTGSRSSTVLGADV